MQLLLPAAFFVALWRSGDRHGATAPLWWLGQNCWNISVYVRDARTQELPLVGGGEHDWALLLGGWGRLAQDQALANAVRLLGLVLYVLAIVGGWMWLRSPPVLDASGTGDSNPEHRRVTIKPLDRTRRPK
jgi:hypothetical protein